MIRFLFLILTIFISFISNYIFCQEHTDQDNIKLHTYGDLILWEGLNCPEDFDSKKITDPNVKSRAMSVGLKACENEAHDDNNPFQQVYQEALSSQYYYFSKDYKKGLYWAFKCAERGSSKGLAILWDAYNNGNGIVQDSIEGLKYRFLAAARGHE